MKRIGLVALFMVFAGMLAKMNAQEASRVRYQYFSNDSLKGFDEQAARMSAISEGFLGDEFPIRMNMLKRQYINAKYDLVPHNQPSGPAIPNMQVLPGCVNEDFEASTAGQITTSTQINGWVVTGGSHTLGSQYNSCNLSGCCPNNPLECVLITAPATGYIDNTIGSQYPIYSVFGTDVANSAAAASANTHIAQPLKGNNFIRVNSNNNNYSLSRLSKTFSVTSANSLFQFAFISVFATGHSCCDAGAFKINLYNGSQSIPCPNFTISAPSGGSFGCPGGAGTPNYYVTNSNTTYTYNSSGQSNGSYIYNRWQINSIDLTPYIGQNITIDIVTSDCTAGGHYGYIYFDAQCGAMTITGNGTEFPADSTNVKVPTCGAAGATITAQAGLGPYSWIGPGVPTNYSTPSYTNQVYVSNISATYTLQMNPAGSCQPINKIVTTTVTPAPLLAASVVQAQCGGTMAVVSLTPSGSAAVPSSLTWSPSPLSLNSSTTVGNYQIPTSGVTIVTVTAKDPLGCKVVTNATVMPAPPIPSFTIQNITNQYSITCKTPSIDLNAYNTYTYGTLNYFWATPSATFNTSSVTIFNPGNVTVTITDPVTNCVTTRTTSILINTVAPTSSATPINQVINCTNLAAQTVTLRTNLSTNVIQSIYAPTGGTAQTVNDTAYFSGTSPGTYTYVVENAINGCKTTKQFTISSTDDFPTYNLLSNPSNFTVGCNAKGTVTINISNAATTNPPGGVVHYTILPPGFTGTNIGVGPTSAFTFTAAGTYTAITKSLNSGCMTKLPFSILNNKFGPPIDTVIAERTVLDCTHPTVTVVGHTDSTNVKYEWFYAANSATNTFIGDSVVVSSNTAAPNNTVVSTYSLTVTDLNSTCPSFTTITILQNILPPTVSVTVNRAITCFEPNIIVSMGGKNNSKFPGTLAAPYNVRWIGPSPQVPSEATPQYTCGVPTPSGSNQYTVIGVDNLNGCIDTAYFDVADGRDYPVVNNPEAPAPSVLDCGTTNAKLSPIITSSAAALTYSWSGGPSTATLSGINTKTLTTSSIGEYNILVTNTISGCATSAQMSVKDGSLTVGFDADSYEGFAPMVVTFNNTSTSSLGNSNIQSWWNYGNSVTGTITAATSQSITTTITKYDQPGTYSVTMWAMKGSCLGSFTRVIKVMAPSEMVVPNIFTPNGDKVNDLFFLKATNLSNLEMSIYDRWGHLVYAINTDKGQMEWDGKNQAGAECSEGVYFYTLKATGKDGASYEKRGNITLTR